MGRVGSVSQSAQFAPYDDGYNYVQAEPASKIYNAAQYVPCLGNMPTPPWFFGWRCR